MENNELVFLESNLNMSTIAKNKVGTFVQTQQRNLQSVDGLAELVEHLLPFENIVITERTLVVRGKVFSIESGRTFNALVADVVPYASELAQFSDIIMFKTLQCNRLSLVFKNDPGRRNCSLVGRRVLREVLSVN